MRYSVFKRTLSLFLPLAVLIPAVLVHSAAPLPLEQLRLKMFDTYQRMQPRIYQPVPVTIIDVDEESLKRVGQWPWSRERLASLTTRLCEYGSAAVGFDIVFAEQDRTSPTLLLPTWKYFLGNAISKNIIIPDYDATFAAAIQHCNVVSGFVLSDTVSEMPTKKFGMVIKGENPTDNLFPYAGAVSSLEMLTKAARGNGALNATPDNDGLIRKVPLLFRVRDQVLPSLVAETLRIAQGASTYVVTATDAGISSVKIGAYDIPTDRHGHVWIHYTPYQFERYIPAWEVLEDGFEASKLDGHLVLVGTSAAGLKDIRSTPLNPVTNGVEIHAQALEQMLGGHFLQRPDWLETAELIGMVVAGLLVWGVLKLTSPYSGAICTVAILSAACWGSWIGFSRYHMLIDPVSPSLVMLLIYLIETLIGYIATERERRHVRHAFSHYMSPALVKRLVEKPDSLKLGGEMKEMTILFCDIRGFTTIAEQYDAQGLTRFINRFLTPMTNIILERQGTIDKYMGDCIMAFWNAPLDDADHAMNACRSALAMIEGLELLNATRYHESMESVTPFIPVRIGIGLNTDICCVGNMGSDQRFDYSVLGDGVNLASRLEGQSSYYGVTVVMGEKTNAAVRGLAIIELDMVKVKGKTEAVRIFGLMGGENLAALPEWQDVLRVYDAMLQAYRSQQWVAALDALSATEHHAGSLGIEMGGCIALYRERITAYQHIPPLAGWDGVYIAISK